MYKTPTIISDCLSIGSFLKAEEMTNDGWKTICVASGSDVAKCDINIEMVDGRGNDSKTIKEAIGWIIGQWKEGHKVFVCCRHGMNRSVAIAAGALAVSRKCEWLSNGLKEISSKRLIVSPRDDTLYEVLSVVMELRDVGPSRIEN